MLPVISWICCVSAFSPIDHKADIEMISSTNLLCPARQQTVLITEEVCMLAYKPIRSKKRKIHSILQFHAWTDSSTLNSTYKSLGVSHTWCQEALSDNVRFPPVNPSFHRKSSAKLEAFGSKWSTALSPCKHGMDSLTWIGSLTEISTIVSLIQVVYWSR